MLFNIAVDGLMLQLILVSIGHLFLNIPAYICIIVYDSRIYISYHPAKPNSLMYIVGVFFFFFYQKIFCRDFLIL